MSDQDELKVEPLQFDEAEYAESEASVPACAACKREIADEYYSVDGAIVCGECRRNIADALEGGSGMRRLVRATLFGVGAAAAGFAIYFGVMYVTNYEIGLISILVGFMVGAAVRAGSGGRGGWLYQLLAVFLVYSAIVASYGSTAILMAIKQDKVEQAADRPPARPDDAADAAPAKQADAVKPPVVGDVAPAPAEILLGLMVIVGFLYALPIRVGFESPIGLLIIGFALWEAWKINKKTPIVFTGPHRFADEGGSLPQMAPGHV
jgi:hypothetical protein